jgi:hypothetical protein
LADGQIAINQADDVLFTHKPDGTSRRFLLPKRHGVADSPVVIGPAETYIGIASLTVSRTATLPLASAYPVGHPLAIVDEGGAVSPTIALTIAPQGSDKINGAATLALTTAFSGVLLFSDGTSKWTAIALPAGTASNALLYVAQSLTSGQQDQARTNLSGAQAASPSATTTLVATDLDRDQFVTGTSTLTMPGSVAPGWRTGAIMNSNAVNGLVTLAVPSGHSLDGTTNGVTTLFPYQRARLQLINAGAWRTVWVDRSPITATISANAVASADLALPAGYGSFELLFHDVKSLAGGAGLNARFSDDAGATFKAGASDYAQEQGAFYFSGPTQSATTGSALLLTGSMNTAGLAAGRALITPGIPGNANNYPTLNHQAQYTDTGGNLAVYFTSGSCSAIGANRVSGLRLLFGSGTGNINATVRGIP